MYIISYTLLFLTSLDRSYRTLRKPNEVFDRMVETMSVVSSYSKREKDSDDSSYRRRMQKRKSRRSSSLLQVPSPESSSGAGGLSFVKSASSFNERSTSSKASEASDEKVLPPWMINTFLSLSKNHPLRLLLPPELNNTPDIQTIDNSSQESPLDSVFAFNVMDQGSSKPSSPTLCSNIHGESSAPPITEKMDNLPVPFSTPGPASRISVSNPARALLFTYPFRSRNHIEPHADEIAEIGPFDAHTITFEPKDVISLDNNCAQERFSFNLTNVSSSPTLRSSSPPPLKVHGLMNTFEEVEFQWTSFDRANIVAPPIQKKVTFALDDDELIDYDSIVGSSVSSRFEETCKDAQEECLDDDIAGYHFATSFS
ncbi:hypothetical protein BJ165DRAFT_941493 [Panaeolus papilionaceus]|nr:hypothetical protein BJ165DRAFT_941493 [Panaeolus papilionaceus]